MAPSINRTGKRSRSMMTSSSSSSPSSVVALAAALSVVAASSAATVGAAFVAPAAPRAAPGAAAARSARPALFALNKGDDGQDTSFFSSLFSPPEDPTARKRLEKTVGTLCSTLGFSALFLTNPLLPHLPFADHFASARAEDELYAKYGGKGLDTSLVDKDCLVDKCSLQAKACLQDDPDCRKGLTCTAKCLGDNACITGCFARYGTPNLDGLLKCTIEDHDCIKVAILEGGADAPGEEPRPPAKPVENFDLTSMEGRWYKVAGYNPNYDCYACQRNTFSSPEGGIVDDVNDKLGRLPNGNVRIPTGGLLGGALSGVGADKLQVDVEFSMPRMLPDGSPPPPSGTMETFQGEDGLQSVGYNAYSTHETMVFDAANRNEVAERAADLVLGRKGEERSYARTAHSEGEMFGLKFWENWYVLGQNDPDQPEFKFVYYNGKTRQNTYDGAFVYSRTRDMSPSAMEKVYKIASEAGMNPDQFCKIQNGCFDKEESQASSSMYDKGVEREGLGSPSNPFRGILASTKVSEFFGVESVAAESEYLPKATIANDYLRPAGSQASTQDRPWWNLVGDYLEDPRRHFRLMDSLRTDMDWPEYVKNQ
ncbi:hypothetical protein ACHAWF_006553 [Thalassiosira exigua]